MWLGFVLELLFLACTVTANEPCPYQYLQPYQVIPTVEPTASAALHNNHLVVASNALLGSVQLFQRSGGNWVSLRTQNFQTFIASVAIGQRHYAVGFPGQERVNVYTFGSSSATILEREGVETPLNDIRSFGSSLSIQHDFSEPWLFVGAPNTRYFYFGQWKVLAGAVVGFKETGNLWRLQQHFIQTVPRDFGYFGTDVKSKDRFLLIGSSGFGAELYSLNFTGLYHHLSTFPNDNPAITSYGDVVALGNSALAIAGFGNVVIYQNFGIGFVKSRQIELTQLTRESRNCLQPIVASGNEQIDALDITPNEDALFVGVPLSRISGIPTGFVFGISLQTYTIRTILSQTPFQANNGFGSSIVATNDLLGVGSYNQRNIAFFNIQDFDTCDRKCSEYGAIGCKKCVHDHYLNETRGCLPCGTAAGQCKKCDGIKCLDCGNGHWFNPTPNRCEVCSGSNVGCNACDGLKCTSCSRGFYFKNDSQSCMPCTDFGNNCLECDVHGCKTCRNNAPVQFQCCLD